MQAGAAQVQQQGGRGVPHDLELPQKGAHRGQQLQEQEDLGALHAPQQLQQQEDLSVLHALQQLQQQVDPLALQPRPPLPQQQQEQQQQQQQQQQSTDRHIGTRQLEGLRHILQQHTGPEGVLIACILLGGDTDGAALPVQVQPHSGQPSAKPAQVHPHPGQPLAPAAAPAPSTASSTTRSPTHCTHLASQPACAGACSCGPAAQARIPRSGCCSSCNAAGQPHEQAGSSSARSYEGWAAGGGSRAASRQGPAEEPACNVPRVAAASGAVNNIAMSLSQQRPLCAARQQCAQPPPPRPAPQGSLCEQQRVHEQQLRRHHLRRDLEGLGSVGRGIVAAAKATASDAAAAAEAAAAPATVTGTPASTVPAPVSAAGTAAAAAAAATAAATDGCPATCGPLGCSSSSGAPFAAPRGVHPPPGFTPKASQRLRSELLERAASLCAPTALATVKQLCTAQQVCAAAQGASCGHAERVRTALYAGRSRRFGLQHPSAATLDAHGRTHTYTHKTCPLTHINTHASTHMHTHTNINTLNKKT